MNGQGEVVGRIVERFLARAEAAGDTRARDYLRERIRVVTDAWELRKNGPARLGYERRKSTTKEIARGQRPVG